MRRPLREERRRLPHVAQSTLTGAFCCRKGAHALVRRCGCGSSAERHLPGVGGESSALPFASISPPSSEQNTRRVHRPLGDSIRPSSSQLLRSDSCPWSYASSRTNTFFENGSVRLQNQLIWYG